MGERRQGRVRSARSDVVILPDGDLNSRRIYVIPRGVADKNARTYATEKMVNVREYRIDEVARKFAAYENNFRLSKIGAAECGA